MNKALTGMQSVLAIVVLLVFFGNIPAHGLDYTFDRIRLHFNDIRLEFDYRHESGQMRITGKLFAGAWYCPMDDDWKIAQVTETIYHLRHKSWPDFFWEVSPNSQAPRKISKGKFGISSQAGLPIPGATLRVSTPKNVMSHGYVNIRLDHSELLYDRKGKRVLFATDGGNIDVTDMLVTRKLDSSRYQFLHKEWKDLLWQVDLDSEQVWEIRGAHSRKLGIKVRLEGKRLETREPRLFEDFGFTELGNESYPQSAWIEAQKKTYRALLTQRTFHILVAPFQVQGFAIDRVGRSLMTRYLVHEIGSRAGASVPNPTLVARALGENARTIDEDEIYRLANDLRVKTLIRGAVGYVQNNEMCFTLLVQVREGDKPIDSATKVTRLDRQVVPFSDENPPEESFRRLLDDITVALPFKFVEKTALPAAHNKMDSLAVPATLLEITKSKPASPVTSAHYLQFLGMLYPGHSTEMEHLFERSLTALSDISGEAPDYRLLKARALFYLHRRPAALVALGTPSTPEEKAFQALLNGHLPDLKKWTPRIESPLKRLMAQIELNDLRTTYGEPLKDSHCQQIAGDYPEWAMLITRRLKSSDTWYAQSNMAIKEALDKLLPIPGFTAGDIMTSRKALGKLSANDETMDLAAYEHYRRLLTDHGESVHFLNESMPEQRDFLDLLYAISESNLMKDVRITGRNKGLAKEALNMLDAYGTVYRGHPAMTYLRGTLLSVLWKKNDENTAHYLTERSDLYAQAHFWAGGQGEREFAAGFKHYAMDYPQRRGWLDDMVYRGELSGNVLYDSVQFSFDLADRKQLQRAIFGMNYSHDSFWAMDSIYNILTSNKKTAEAAAFLESQKHRYVGNPERATFIIGIIRKNDTVSALINAIESEIVEMPWVSQLYAKLGMLYMEQGNFKKAFSVFDSDPSFHEGEDADRVKVANYAFWVAANFWWRGAIEESHPFFEIAANSRTASGAEMAANGFLSMMKQDYIPAAMAFRAMIERYDDSQGYREFLTLLHLMGYHQEAWSVLNVVDIKRKLPEIMVPVIIGQRMEAKTAKEINEWLSRDSLRDVSNDHIVSYLMKSYMMDRPPDEQLPVYIENALKRFKDPDSSNLAEEYKPYLARLAKGYYDLRTGRLEDAFAILKGKLIEEMIYEPALPYYAWSGIKTGKASEVDKMIANFETKESTGKIVIGNRTKISGINERPELFEVCISRAFLSGLQGKHQQAIENLRLAQYQLPFTGNRPIFTWYQLVEACEWLFEDTGHAEYRTLALELAKRHQRIQPMFAWAYAVEAKYATDAADRRRALAITLYLDKQSERISKIPDSEKAEALKWLKDNNPFLVAPSQKKAA